MPAYSQPVSAVWSARGAGGMRAAGVEREWTWKQLAGVLAIHMALGLAMHRLPPLATIHALATIVAALGVSLYAKRPGVVLMAVFYVAGSEVLWRMSKAFVFHETGKYVLVLLCVIGLLRLERARLIGPALLYLLLLLPSVAITYYMFYGFDDFRRAVLFSLAGPLAITAAICFCANLRPSEGELRGSVFMMAFPLMGVAAITLVSTYWREGVTFTTQANFETSGGFGPNQVASALALGAMLLFLSAILSRPGLPVRLLAYGAATVFLAQSVMTFSRGGVLSVLISVALVSPILLRTRRQMLVTFGSVAALLVVGVGVYAVLNQYTGGMLRERFQKEGMSGREQLMQTDLEIWQENPVFGVGVGISKYYHKGFKASHTEFTRALAENGSLGALAYLTLALLCAARGWELLRRQKGVYRALLLASIFWAFLYMFVNANRTAAPALAMGLGFVTVQGGPRKDGV